MQSNKKLNKAISQRNDEFYTRLKDIKKELRHYERHFKDKVVYCNCDDPFRSQFYRYFRKNFERLGLKKLIATCYDGREPSIFPTSTKDMGVAWYAEFNDCENNYFSKLKGNGDFRSDECINILRESDIVVTNPPFSLFHDHIDQILRYGKEFLVVGNKLATSKRSLMHEFKRGRVRTGYNINLKFKTATGKVEPVGTCWYTNLQVEKDFIPLTKLYNPDTYPQCENVRAIYVGATADIPKDYKGPMAVPYTFLLVFNPDQFDLISHEHDVYIGGERRFGRVIVQIKTT